MAKKISSLPVVKITKIYDLFDAAKRRDTAPSQISQKSQMSRTEILEEASKKKCICGGKWFQCTTQVPVNNKIHPFEFADCFRNLLIIGRGKCRNIFIPNCGKTFLLKPLEDIFLIFSMIDTTVG